MVKRIVYGKRNCVVLGIIVDIAKFFVKITNMFNSIFTILLWNSNLFSQFNFFFIPVFTSNVYVHKVLLMLTSCDNLIINVLNQRCDNKGHILILNVIIDVRDFALINLYNTNTKNEKVEVLNTLLTMMKTSRRP